METTETARFNLAHTTNADLLATLRSLVGRGNQIAADILAHLAELDARKLYLGQGFASLFTYAVAALGFSEGSAYKRVYAARTARRFPVIFELVHKGEIHLSAVTLLAPHLTAENHRELLAAAAHQSKRDLAQLIATRFPSPDVPTLLRKLPQARPAAPLATTPTSLPSSPTPQVRTAAATTTPGAVGADAGVHAGMTLKLAQQSPGPVDTSVAASAPSVEAAAEAAARCKARRPASCVTPLSAHSYHLQLTLSQKGYDALCRAQELLGFARAQRRPGRGLRACPDGTRRQTRATQARQVPTATDVQTARGARCDAHCVCAHHAHHGCGVDCSGHAHRDRPRP